MMSIRYPKDCPVPGCSKTNLVKLSNHLADVHLLSSEERRFYLQEAKLCSKKDKYLRTLDDELVHNQLAVSMHVTFKHPTNIQVCGPTFSGKTYWTENVFFLFPPGKYSRTISLNTHYIVTFKHPRDSLGVSILARQAFPRSTKYVMESYEDAINTPMGT